MTTDLSFEVYPRIARHAALREIEPLLGALRTHKAPGPETSATFRRHHLATLVLETIQEAGVGDQVDAALVRAIESARPDQPSAATVLHTFDEIHRALRAEGIEAVLLKGVYFAERLYGGYRRRPQFDLDVLVRANDRGRAGRVLHQLGYTRATCDLHSETFTRGEEKADVHGWLRRAPAYRIDEPAVWRDVWPARLEQFDVPTLSDEFNLVLLGLSCFEDFGQGMAKIKQLLDLWLFLRQVDATTDWEAFFDRRGRERTDGVIANVFALVVALFESGSELPRIAGALDARRHVLHDATRERALALLSAPRKHPANLAWFGRVYPGNFWRYLAAFYLAGFPENLAQLRSGRVLATLGAARRK